MTDKTEATPSGSSALFDLRIVIALLFGVFGAILTVLGIIGPSEEDLAKAGGVALNLWTGLGMLVLAALFVTWQRLRPT